MTSAIGELIGEESIGDYPPSYHVSTKEIDSLSTTVSQIRISYSTINKIPDIIFEIPNITHIFINETYIDSIPDEIKNLQNLEHLFIHDSKIKYVSPNIYQN